MASATIEQPGWLAARRERAAALSASLDLPSFKGHAGWEFTDISKLDLAAYAPAGAGDADVVERVEHLPRLLGAHGGVEVGERLSVEALLEDREVCAQLARVELR